MFSGGSENFSTMDSRIELASNKLEQGQTKEAENIFKQIVSEIHQASSIAAVPSGERLLCRSFTGLAKCALADGNRGQAETYLNEASKCEPALDLEFHLTFAELKRLLGDSYREEGYLNVAHLIGRDGPKGREIEQKLLNCRHKFLVSYGLSNEAALAYRSIEKSGLESLRTFCTQALASAQDGAPSPIAPNMIMPAIINSTPVPIVGRNATPWSQQTITASENEDDSLMTMTQETITGDNPTVGFRFAGSIAELTPDHSPSNALLRGSTFPERRLQDPIARPSRTPSARSSTSGSFSLAEGVQNLGDWSFSTHQSSGSSTSLNRFTDIPSSSPSSSAQPRPQLPVSSIWTNPNYTRNNNNTSYNSYRSMTNYQFNQQMYATDDNAPGPNTEKATGLWISNISRDLDTNCFRSILQQFGRVKEFAPHPNGEPGAYAFVFYQTAAEAEKAATGLHGHRFSGINKGDSLLKVRYRQKFARRPPPTDVFSCAASGFANGLQYSNQSPYWPTARPSVSSSQQQLHNPQSSSQIFASSSGNNTLAIPQDLSRPWGTFQVTQSTAINRW